MAAEVQEIVLPGGAVVHARLTTSGAHGDGYEDVGVAEVLQNRVDDLRRVIAGVGGSVLDAARAACPDEATVTFGLEFSVKEGKVISVLAGAEAKTALQVSLTWKLAENAAQQPAAAAPLAPPPATPPPAVPQPADE
ncbi:CU044_2847 family protein [Streptomyces sp. NPDC090052]|uniref:CU044_2847 family protein n=1 Tax=unclassified Streptomyces TaxID=2593676 RepID=UPI0022550788|nr:MULTISPECIES: CU044_2847 family protein [unclassified Streptomyces]MCX4723807.1 CU044_2847 family protein [Streptomyces sp. NBC_01306]WSV06616.1 hypothetical protein OG372_25290 [Streptomyces sp. NBC_01020]WSX44736.1 hypothetical protein OG760_25280 [Streptomyces sp. NBC_00963]WSX67249.1 hypothetical protein OG221_11835 [Streptomyces sp. NBC_00932]